MVGLPAVARDDVPLRADSPDDVTRGPVDVDAAQAVAQGIAVRPRRRQSGDVGADVVADHPVARCIWRGTRAVGPDSAIPIAGDPVAAGIGVLAVADLVVAGRLV